MHTHKLHTTCNELTNAELTKRSSSTATLAKKRMKSCKRQVATNSANLMSSAAFSLVLSLLATQLGNESVYAPPGVVVVVVEVVVLVVVVVVVVVGSGTNTQAPA